MENSATFEKALTRRLKKAFEPTQIKEIAASMAALQSNGLRIDDVFPYGIRVNPDGASIRGNITVDQLKDLNRLIREIPNLNNVQIFPRGILAPDGYRIHVNLGEAPAKQR